MKALPNLRVLNEAELKQRKVSERGKEVKKNVFIYYSLSPSFLPPSLPPFIPFALFSSSSLLKSCSLHKEITSHPLIVLTLRHISEQDDMRNRHNTELE